MLLERLNQAIRRVDGAVDLATLRGWRVRGRGVILPARAARGLAQRVRIYQTHAAPAPGDPVNALLSLGYTLLGNN